MNNLIFPEIFTDSVNAFFTRKHLGINVDEICRILAIEKCNVYLPIQKHTDNVQVIGSDLEQKIADSVLTERKGILIGVQVADCVPVLCYDPVTLLVGAAHAGWRGTASQIVKKTITYMVEKFGSSPENIRVAFGPSIRWTCYHVGKEVIEAIYKATGEGDYYIQENGKYCVDLASANRYQALSLGIPEENIWISNDCTYCHPEDYHSFRYEKTYNGSQGGFIGMF